MTATPTPHTDTPNASECAPNSGNFYLAHIFPQFEKLEGSLQ